MSRLDELKKSFIVDKETYDEAKLPDFIEKVMRHCKVTSDGAVYIENQSLIVRDRIAIILIARFLANKLDPRIKVEVSASDLEAMLGIDTKQVFARLGDLTSIKIAIKTDKGTYRISPFYIEALLNEIEAKYSLPDDIENQTKPAIQKTEKPRARKPRTTDTGLQSAALEKIDKNKYDHVYALPTVQLKCFAALKIAHNELDMDGLTTPQMMKILQDRFRIKMNWSAVSNAMKSGDQHAYTDSEAVPGHATARKYRLMHKGELYLEAEIKKKSKTA